MRVSVIITVASDAPNAYAPDVVEEAAAVVGASATSSVILPASAAVIFMPVTTPELITVFKLLMALLFVFAWNVALLSEPFSAAVLNSANLVLAAFGIFMVFATVCVTEVLSALQVNVWHAL